MYRHARRLPNGGTRPTLPKAAIVVDKFHIFKLAGDAFDVIRRRYRRRLGMTKEERDILAKRQAQWSVADKFKMHIMSLKAPQLYEAYLLREIFYDIWACPTRAQVLKEYRAWRTCLPAGQRKVFGELLTALAYWEQEIFANFDHPGVSNAYTEGANRLIRRVQRSGLNYSKRCGQS